MNELEALLRDIDVLRENLNKILNKRHSSLTDPEIISASQKLNTAIVKYTALVNKIDT